MKTKADSTMLMCIGMILKQPKRVVDWQCRFETVLQIVFYSTQGGLTGFLGRLKIIVSKV